MRANLRCRIATDAGRNPQSVAACTIFLHAVRRAGEIHRGRAPARPREMVPLTWLAIPRAVAPGRPIIAARGGCVQRIENVGHDKVATDSWSARSQRRCSMRCCRAHRRRAHRDRAARPGDRGDRPRRAGPGTAQARGGSGRAQAAALAGAAQRANDQRAAGPRTLARDRAMRCGDRPPPNGGAPLGVLVLPLLKTSIVVSANLPTGVTAGLRTRWAGSR